MHCGFFFSFFLRLGQWISRISASLIRHGGLEEASFFVFLFLTTSLKNINCLPYCSTSSFSVIHGVISATSHSASATWSGTDDLFIQMTAAWWERGRKGDETKDPYFP